MHKSVRIVAFAALSVFFLLHAFGILDLISAERVRPYLMPFQNDDEIRSVAKYSFYFIGLWVFLIIAATVYVHVYKKEKIKRTDNSIIGINIAIFERIRGIGMDFVKVGAISAFFAIIAYFALRLSGYGTDDLAERLFFFLWAAFACLVVLVPDQVIIRVAGWFQK